MNGEVITFVNPEMAPDTDPLTESVSRFQNLCRNNLEDKDVISNAFADIINETNPLIYRVLVSTGLQEHDVNDLMQEVNIRMFKAFSRGLFEGRSKANTYIYTLVHNAMYTHQEKASRRSRVEELIGEKAIFEEIAVDAADVETAAIDNVENGVKSILDGLDIDEKDKQLLLLNAVKELSPKEILGLLAAGFLGGYAISKIARNHGAIKVATKRARDRASAAYKHPQN